MKKTVLANVHYYFDLCIRINTYKSISTQKIRAFNLFNLSKKNINNGFQVVMQAQDGLQIRNYFLFNNES